MLNIQRGRKLNTNTGHCEYNGIILEAAISGVDDHRSTTINRKKGTKKRKKVRTLTNVDS